MKLSLKLKSLATKGGYLAGELPGIVGLAVSAGARTLGRRRALNRREIGALTSRLLTRSLEKSDIEYFGEVIDERKLSDWALPLSFFRLPDSVEMKLLKTLALHHCHLARVGLIREHLPPANDILDLGGAVDRHPEGALIASGYPHRPRTVTIIDLPDPLREFAGTAPRPQDTVTPDGTRVTYQFCNMVNLKQFDDESFDLVWSGQSIEHVTEVEADLVIREAMRVLRPGGFFCLDTPNRKLTRLISDRYLHPDHKIEYTPDELAEKIERAGFKVREKLAVTPLPKSVELGRVSKLEIIKETRVNDDYRNGFSFFLKCEKVAVPEQPAR